MAGRIPTLSEIWEVSREGGATSESPYLHDGLEASWGMMDGSGGTVYDVSGSEHHAPQNQQDQKQKWIASPYGGALGFDGANDRLDLGASVARGLDSINAITVSMWLYRESTIAWDGIFSRGESGDRAPWIYLGGGVGTIWFQLQTAVGGYNDLSISSTNELAEDQWTLLTCRWTGTAGNVFFDSQQDPSSGTTTGNTIFNPTNDTCYIGHVATLGYFHGAIGLSQLHTRPLDLWEIQQSYEDPWSIWRKRPVQVAVAVDDVTATNAFGSSSISFDWTVNP